MMMHEEGQDLLYKSVYYLGWPPEATRHPTLMEIR